MSVGKRIKKLRKDAGLLQSELAKKVGVSAQVISNTERDYTKPSTELVNRCAACFGVPADYILGRTAIDYTVPADQVEISIFSVKANNRLKQLRMSSSDLIRKSGITEKTCSAILAGKEIPDIDTAVRISDALNTSVEYLSGKSEYSCSITSEDEQDIIIKFRHLSKKGRRIFLGMMESLEEK